MTNQLRFRWVMHNVAIENRISGNASRLTPDTRTCSWRKRYRQDQTRRSSDGNHQPCDAILTKLCKQLWVCNRTLESYLSQKHAEGRSVFRKMNHVPVCKEYLLHSKLLFYWLVLRLPFSPGLASALPPSKNSGRRNFTVNLVHTFLRKCHST